MAGVNPSKPAPALASGGVINIPWGVPKPLQCIVAVARNGVIGKEGKLPWHIPEDLAWFLDQTRGGVMIEGPACYAELGKALPDRGTVVVSRDPTKTFPGAERAASLAEAIVIAERMDQWTGPTWITGGERIYAEGLPLCERLLITRIDRDTRPTFYISPAGSPSGAGGGVVAGGGVLPIRLAGADGFEEVAEMRHRGVLIGGLHVLRLLLEIYMLGTLAQVVYLDD